MTVLVTGFDPFGGDPFNLSEKVLSALAVSNSTSRTPTIDTMIVPTRYGVAASKIIERRKLKSYSTVLMLGQSEGGGPMQIERFAVNAMDSDGADNSGIRHAGTPIDVDGPAARQTNVDLRKLQQFLIARSVRFVRSNHAGTFVCNDLYYRILNACAGDEPVATALFVHLPCGPFRMAQEPFDRAAIVNDFTRDVTILIDGLRAD
ncbi:MAG: hypothetical protein AAGF59_11060 [Pseudomonadota bacterium]